MSGPQKDVRARKESGDYRKSSQETQPGLFRRVFGGGERTEVLEADTRGFPHPPVL